MFLYKLSYFSSRVPEVTAKEKYCVKGHSLLLPRRVEPIYFVGGDIQVFFVGSGCVILILFVSLVGI